MYYTDIYTRNVLGRHSQLYLPPLGTSAQVTSVHYYVIFRGNKNNHDHNIDVS